MPRFVHHFLCFFLTFVLSIETNSHTFFTLKLLTARAEEPNQNSNDGTKTFNSSSTRDANSSKAQELKGQSNQAVEGGTDQAMDSALGSIPFLNQQSKGFIRGKAKEVRGSGLAGTDKMLSGFMNAGPEFSENVVVNNERWLSTALMFGIAMVAFGVLGLCEGVSADALVFTVGGFVYVIGEAITNFQYQGFHKKSIDYTIGKDGKPDQDNIQYLRDQKTSYEGVKRISEMKALFQFGAGAIFFTASIIAAVQAFMQLGAYFGCMASIGFAATALSTTCPGGATSECSSLCQAAQAANVLPGAGVAATAACITQCEAQVALECGTCSTATAKAAGLISKAQLEYLKVWPWNQSLEYVKIKDVLSTNLEEWESTCINANHKVPPTVCPMNASGVAANALHLQKYTEEKVQLAQEAVKAAEQEAKIKEFGGGEQFVKLMEMNNKLKQAEETAKKTKESGEKAINEASSKQGMASGHAIAAVTESIKVCKDSTFIMWKDLLMCPQGLKIPGFGFMPTNPENLKYGKAKNPFAKFFEFLASTANADDKNAHKNVQGNQFSIADGSKQADKNEETISGFIGFGFVGAAVVATAITYISRPNFWTDFFKHFAGIPALRAFLYGVVGTTAMTTGGLSVQTSLIMEQNIKRLDDVINGTTINRVKLGAAAAGTDVPFNEITADMMAPFLENQPTTTLPNGEKTPCLQGDGKGNCIQFSGNVTAMLGTLGLDAETLQSASQSAASAESLQGQGSIGKSQFSTVAALAAKVRKLRDKSLGLRKLLSQKLAEAKLPSVTDEQVAQQFKNVIRDALKNNPNLAGGLSNLTSGIDSAVAAVPAKEDKKAIDTAMNAALKAMPSTKVPDLDLQALMETKYEFQEKGQDQQLAELAAQGGYNIPKEDIIEDNKEDIFKMISIRYFKSAYPVFFQEDKTEAKKESKKKK